MIRKLEQSHGNVIGYSIGGEVTEDEYRQTASELRDAIAMHGTIRLLFRINDVSATSFFKALDDRVEFATTHGDQIDRIAIVTGETATEWLTKLGDRLSALDIEHFDPAEEDKAWAWIE